MDIEKRRRSLFFKGFRRSEYTLSQNRSLTAKRQGTKHYRILSDRNARVQSCKKA